MTDEQLHLALQLLWRHTWLCSAAVLLLALLRPLLLRGLGASATYLAWLLVPLMALSPALPNLPQQAPTPMDIAASVAAPPLPAAIARLDVVTADAAPAAPLVAALTLTLWSTGALALALLLTWRQRRFTAGLLTEPDGRLRGPAGSSPALLGLWRPRLVLPQDFEDRFDAEEQALILAHEAVHARRRDNAWNLLAAALLALQWFNPLAWWALGRMRADQELACDAAVLNGPRAPTVRRYLGTLLKSAPAQQQMLPVLANGWAPRHPLLERARMLGGHHRSAGRRRLGAMAALALCAGFTLLARAAQPSPPAPTPPSPAAPTAAGKGGLAMLIQLDSRLGQGAWQHRQMKLPLPPHYPMTGQQGIRVNWPQGDWCLGLLVYGFPDGSVRPLAELMDASCRNTLAALGEVPVGPGRLSQAARLQQQDLLARIGLEWVDPEDPRIPALMRQQAEQGAALTAAQQAQVEQQRAHIATQTAELRAVDTAWRQARHPAPTKAPAAASAPTAAGMVQESDAAAVAPAAVEPTIELALSISLREQRGGSSRTYRTEQSMRLAPGKHGTVFLRGEADQPSANQVAIDLAAEDIGDGKIKLFAELKKGDPLVTVSRPRLVTKLGVKALIEQGREDPEVNEQLSISVTPTLIGKP